jgi:hypothetical protein
MTRAAKTKARRYSSILLSRSTKQRAPKPVRVTLDLISPVPSHKSSHCKTSSPRRLLPADSLFWTSFLGHRNVRAFQRYSVFMSRPIKRWKPTRSTILPATISCSCWTTDLFMILNSASVASTPCAGGPSVTLRSPAHTSRSDAPPDYSQSRGCGSLDTMSLPSDSLRTSSASRIA